MCVFSIFVAAFSIFSRVRLTLHLALLFEDLERAEERASWGDAGELFMVIGKNIILFSVFFFVEASGECVVFPFVCAAAAKKTKDLAKTVLEKYTLGHSSRLSKSGWR